MAPSSAKAMVAKMLPVAVGVGCLDGQGQSRVAQGVGGRLGLQGDHRRHGVDDRDGHRVGIGGKAGAVGHAHQVGVSARLVGARREGVTGAHGGQGAVGRLLEPLVGERVVAALDAVHQRNIGANALHSARILDADDTAIGDLVHTVDDILDLTGIDIVAVGDDHALDALFKVNVAILVHRAEVAGIQPDVAVGQLA